MEVKPISLTKLAVVVISYLVVIFIGYLFVRSILRWFPTNSYGLKRTGGVIGILERCLVLTFILFNQYVAISIIVAAKSIARFEELKDRRFAEYYLIGTLSSVLFATIIDAITSWILS